MSFKLLKSALIIGALASSSAHAHFQLVYTPEQLKAGTFTFGIPKAGQWGFSAITVGPKTEYKGKQLSQDAVLWVQAHKIN